MCRIGCRSKSSGWGPAVADGSHIQVKRRFELDPALLVGIDSRDDIHEGSLLACCLI